ncbi:MAG: tetratricopeptide repeat protein [Myxococcales bacterium]|nr:tetratricopeptide repeat protein [Myxococcales bacterium]
MDEISVELAYGELEPRRVAEAEQHLLSCERCSALVARLRKGREAAGMLELEEPSSLLEARILAVAGTEKPPASIPRRTGRLLARAGAWVTRPQFAMAAVLVLMVGSSIILLRGGQSSTARKEKVVDEGKPIAAVEQDNHAGAPAVAVPKADEPQTKSVEEKPSPESAAVAPAAPGQPLEAPKVGLKGASDGKESDGDFNSKDDQAGEGSAAKDKKKKPADELEAKKAEDKAIGGVPAMPPMVAAPQKATTGSAASTYDTAMNAYKASKWADAAAGFDAAVAAGDRPSSALLHAGRSYRAAANCDKALVRFQKVLSSHGASVDAPYAALEGGQCAKQLGDLVGARALFEKAKTFPATAAKAQAELDALDKPKAKLAKPSADQAY